MKQLICTRPVLTSDARLTTGQPYTPKTERELAARLKSNSFREATPEDLAAWAKRLQNDPALAALRHAREVDGTSSGDEAKAADTVDAKMEEPAKNKAEPDSKPGASGKPGSTAKTADEPKKDLIS